MKAPLNGNVIKWFNAYLERVALFCSMKTKLKSQLLVKIRSAHSIFDDSIEIHNEINRT